VIVSALILFGLGVTAAARKAAEKTNPPLLMDNGNCFGSRHRVIEFLPRLVLFKHCRRIFAKRDVYSNYSKRENISVGEIRERVEGQRRR
jgi:hypothetical protein